MADGLAASMVYGNGNGNTITHSYGGTVPMNTKKKKCKTKKK